MSSHRKRKTILKVYDQQNRRKEKRQQKEKFRQQRFEEDRVVIRQQVMKENRWFVGIIMAECLAIGYILALYQFMR